MTWLYSMSEGHQQANDEANKTTKLMLTHSTLKASDQTNKQKMTCNITTKITFMKWLYSMSKGHEQANDKANKTTKTMTIDEVILAHRHAYYAD